MVLDNASELMYGIDEEKTSQPFATGLYSIYTCTVVQVIKLGYLSVDNSELHGERIRIIMHYVDGLFCPMTHDIYN